MLKGNLSSSAGSAPVLNTDFQSIAHIAKCQEQRKKNHPSAGVLPAKGWSRFGFNRDYGAKAYRIRFAVTSASGS